MIRTIFLIVIFNVIARAHLYAARSRLGDRLAIDDDDDDDRLFNVLFSLL